MPDLFCFSRGARRYGNLLMKKRVLLFKKRVEILIFYFTNF